MSDKFKEIISSETPVLIDFFATWCQPCKVMSSVLTSVKKNVEDSVRIIKVDIDRYQSIASSYNVRSVPTLILFKKGEIIWQQSGVVDVNTLTGVLKKHKE